MFIKLIVSGFSVLECFRDKRITKTDRVVQSNKKHNRSCHRFSVHAAGLPRRTSFTSKRWNEIRTLSSTTQFVVVELDDRCHSPSDENTIQAHDLIRYMLSVRLIFTFKLFHKIMARISVWVALNSKCLSRVSRFSWSSARHPRTQRKTKLEILDQ